MLKEYIFHYNGCYSDFMANAQEDLEPEEIMYHEHCVWEDGKHCRADMENQFCQCVTAYFDDGTELIASINELEEVK